MKQTKIQIDTIVANNLLQNINKDYITSTEIIEAITQKIDTRMTTINTMIFPKLQKDITIHEVLTAYNYTQCSIYIESFNDIENIYNSQGKKIQVNLIPYFIKASVYYGEKSIYTFESLENVKVIRDSRNYDKIA
ncbi:MAG TPA: hypothetical protein VIK86_07915 [Candidatus Paceibacterota bacterium]